MASIQYVVNATDAASSVFAKIALSADGLDKQLEDLGKRVADPEVNLEDSKFTLGMVRAAGRLDKLSAMVANPEVEVDTKKAQTEILRINAMLDRLGAKKVNVNVDVNRSFFSRLGGLFGFGGGGGGGVAGAAGGGGSILSSLGSVGGGGGLAAGIGGLAALAASLIPSLLPAGLGGIIGGGGILGAFAAGSSADKQLLKLQTALASAKGPQKADLRNQIAQLQKQSGGVLGFYNAAQNVFGTGKTTLLGALGATGPGFSGGAGAPSFLTGMEGILKQISGFIKSIGPQLGDMFRASLPFVGMFVKFLEQAAKVLLPVFTQMLQQMIPYLPLMAKGLTNIVGGLAGFLKAIGPSGMQASAKIFVALTKVMAGVLVGLGHTINWLTENIPTWVHDIASWWDWLRHHTATVFDGIRHDIAHYWDMIFSNTIGTVIRMVAAVTKADENFRHATANVFDGIRHDIAATWDLIWNNTVDRAQRGISDVVDWFKKLPGRAIGALFGFGHQLYAFAHAALDDFLSGLKAVGGTVLSWLKNFIGGIPHAIMSFLHMSPPHAGSVFYDLGANLMRHLESGIKSGARGAVGAAQKSMGAVSGALGGDALANQALARRMFPWGADQWPAFVSVVMRESGFDRFAQNKSSGAYGIAQALPPTKYPFAGQAAGGSHAGAQLSWMFDYIRSRYGTPAGAWAHELSAGWYDQGGWLPPGVSLAVNQTGRPEPVGFGGNTTINVHVHAPVGSNPADIGRSLATYLGEYKKRGGFIYKPGGF